MNTNQYEEDTLKIFSKIEEEDMIYSLQSKNTPADVLIDRIREIRENIFIGEDLKKECKDIQVLIDKQWQVLLKLSEQVDDFL